jgi:8-oxo-dGTP pyrophosphatase MutT (NUDIX family)
MTRYTHAGGVVYREAVDGPRYLLVRARRDPTQWVLPKGHVERGETTEEAAVREVREESGVDAQVVAPLGELRFNDDRVQIFLMRFLAAGRAHENREQVWCHLDDALERSAFQESRELLNTAHQRITAKT